MASEEVAVKIHGIFSHFTGVAGENAPLMCKAIQLFFPNWSGGDSTNVSIQKNRHPFSAPSASILAQSNWNMIMSYLLSECQGELHHCDTAIWLLLYWTYTVPPHLPPNLLQRLPIHPFTHRYSHQWVAALMRGTSRLIGNNSGFGGSVLVQGDLHVEIWHKAPTTDGWGIGEKQPQQQHGRTNSWPFD